MKQQQTLPSSVTVTSLDELAKLSDYSLLDSLNCDPDGQSNGVDYAPRQVFTGHYMVMVAQSLYLRLY